MNGRIVTICVHAQPAKQQLAMVDFGFFPVYDQISLWFREMVANNRR
jgi:hypothetical protein